MFAQGILTHNKLSPTFYSGSFSGQFLALLAQEFPNPGFLSCLTAAFLSSAAAQTGDEKEDEEATQPVSLPQQTISKDKMANILVVEDEGIVALDIKMALRRMGHQVIATVDSGHNAIQMVNTQQPDLILMDIRLKGDIDGIETTQKIQESFSIPIIYLTGQLDEITVKRAQKTSPAGYLGKPFTASELAALIQQVLK